MDDVKLCWSVAIAPSIVFLIVSMLPVVVGDGSLSLEYMFFGMLAAIFMVMVKGVTLLIKLLELLKKN